MFAIWVGVVSNSGAFVILMYYGTVVGWSEWGLLLRTVLWASVIATALIACGLYWFGIRGKGVEESEASA